MHVCIYRSHFLRIQAFVSADWLFAQLPRAVAIVVIAMFIIVISASTE